MAKPITKKADKVEIKVGTETTGNDVVMSQSLRSKLETIKETSSVPRLEDEVSVQQEVTIVAPTKQVQPTKMVKVMLANPHRCSIGGEWYTFQANKQYNVPEQVKKTLLQAGLLLPL